MLSPNKFVFTGVALATLAIMASPANALEIDLDGVNYTRLSEAVEAVYASDDDGPDIINITADTLTTTEVQILLTKPITINGDPDNDGSCEILVDTAGIADATNIGETNKPYLEITAPGDVHINNLRMHPNHDGGLKAAGNIVMGILCAKPPGASDVGNYTFTNVEVSGTDSNNGNSYVEPDTGADLYNTAGYLKWAGRSGTNNGQIKNFGIFQLDTGSGLGTYNTVFDNCKAAMTYGTPINIVADSGTHQVLGGLYGHAARDGIYTASPGTTIKGTAENRVRIVRCTNIDGANSHAIEVQSTADVNEIEYVDIAGLTSANSLAVVGHVSSINYVRSLGKFDPETGRNHAIFINGVGAIDSFTNVTVWTNGNLGLGLVPLGITGAVTDEIQFTDSIFTSDFQPIVSEPGAFTSGTISIAATTATQTFANCALTTDMLVGESLSNPPIEGTGTWVEQDCIYVSPMYLLTLDDYDWSDAQGANDLANGAGNRNVLRPGNPVYQTASSTNGPLYGGAGPATASVGLDVWMLME